MADLEQRLHDPALLPSRQHFWEQAGMAEAKYLRFLRTKEGLFNYTTIRTIGKGGFGEVKLVRKKQDGRLYALKRLVKAQMMVSSEGLARMRAERDAMAESDSEWVVKLYTTFQDDKSLYLLMEYLPGGDLMSMLSLFDEFRFPEHIARFYAAEIVMAIEAIHALGYIHRDIKPENILLDREGHVKLADFGVSKSPREIHDHTYYDELLRYPGPMSMPQTTSGVKNHPRMDSLRTASRFTTGSAAGTPGYTAPELVKQLRCSYEVDWWSLGVLV